jgi:flagellar protein FliO/FliZ
MGEKTGNAHLIKSTFGRISPKLLIIQIALFGLFFGSACAYAQDSTRATSYPSASGGSFIWLTLVTLVLAAVLVGLIAWYIKRNLQLDVPNSAIRILAAQGLGPRERVVVVQVAGRVYVLGHTPNQINLISELEAAEVANLPKMTSFSPDFAKKLSDLLRKGGKA